MLKSKGRPLSSSMVISNARPGAKPYLGSRRAAAVTRGGEYISAMIALAFLARSRRNDLPSPPRASMVAMSRSDCDRALDRSLDSKSLMKSRRSVSYSVVLSVSWAGAAMDATGASVLASPLCGSTISPSPIINFRRRPSRTVPVLLTGKLDHWPCNRLHLRPLARVISTTLLSNKSRSMPPPLAASTCWSSMMSSACS